MFVVTKICANKANKAAVKILQKITNRAIFSTGQALAKNLGNVHVLRHLFIRSVVSSRIVIKFWVIR
jgi:hypothetical protein